MMAKKGVKIMVPLKYLSNIWKTLKMPLINCDINNIYLIIYAPIENQVPTSAIADIKLYVPVLTLSTQDNANRNKYQPKVTMQERSQYLHY